ncbi:MAG: hypothetical protein CMM01_24970 [Rhodopirellula sp.]|nr:hypothetical protein [Rhodopirellula sp.]
MKQIASHNYSSDGEKTVQTIDQGALVVPNTLKSVTECRTIVNARLALQFAKPRFSLNFTNQHRSPCLRSILSHLINSIVYNL